MQPCAHSSAAAHYNRCLLSESQRDRIDVVLVSPRNPLNMGAAARAMANFGFSRLAVVAPYAPLWREARSAVGAPDLLQNAVEFDSLADAVARSTLVVGTGTLRYRNPEQPAVSLPDLPSLAARELERGGRLAILFGSEKHGLTREELSFCHLLVEIPTDSRQPSMNLGQAVAVCLYELAARCALPEGAAEGSQHRLADCADLERLSEVVEEVMLSADAPRDADRHSLRLLLRRLAPSERDARSMMGLFRRILWQLNRKR